MKPIVLAAIGAGVLLVAATAYKAATMPSEEQRIRAGLEESIDASREGRPGGVLEFLSERIRVNELEYSHFQRELASRIRKMKPNVSIASETPIIAGDTATINSPVTLSISIPKFSVTIPNVTITLKREATTEWLVIPSSRWHVTDIDVPPSSLEGLVDPFE